MFGRKLSVEELENWGMVNKVFEESGGEFHGKVRGWLEEQLKVNDGKSMMEMKRLQNAPLRDGRMVAVYNSMDALAERFVEGAPLERFVEKKRALDCEFCIFERDCRVTVANNWCFSEIKEQGFEDIRVECCIITQ